MCIRDSCIGGIPGPSNTPHPPSLTSSKQFEQTLCKQNQARQLMNVSVSGGYQMLWNQGRHQQQQSSKWTRLAQQCIDVSIINWRSARCNTAVTTSLSHYRCISESKTKCKRYAATWKPLLAVLTSTQWNKNKPPSLTIVWHIPKESTRP